MVAPLTFAGRYSGPRNLGTANLGTAWAAIGSAVKVAGARVARAFLSFQIHNGTGVQFRLSGYHTSGGSAFALAAQNSGTGIVLFNELVYQAEQDEDDLISLQWPLGGTVPLVRLEGRITGGTATFVSQAKLVTAI